MAAGMIGEGDARAAILNLLATCTQAGDARKADLYAECFARDGVLEFGTTITGREAIRAWMRSPPPAAPASEGVPGHVSHHLTTCRIDLTASGEASVRTYWLVVGAIGLDHSGYYDDRLVRRDDGWLIAHRRVRVLWRDAKSYTRLGRVSASG